MRVLFFGVVILLQLSAESCVVPTSKELAIYFENNQYWTEVEAPNSFQLAENRPIFITVNFEDLNLTTVRFGETFYLGKEFSFCWESPEKNIIQISKGLLRTKLIKLKSGLYKSWIPFAGTFYYRNDRLVYKSESIKSRGLSSEPM